MVAQLPQNCFDLVIDIEKKFLAGELRNATKAPRITQSFFKFLVGKSTHMNAMSYLGPFRMVKRHQQS